MDKETQVLPELPVSVTISVAFPYTLTLPSVHRRDRGLTRRVTSENASTLSASFRPGRRCIPTRDPLRCCAARRISTHKARRRSASTASWRHGTLSRSGAPETGAHLREIQRQFGPEGVERSVRGLAHTRGEGFAHSAAEHAGFSPAARLSEGGAIGQEAAGAIRASSTSGPLPDDVREKLTNASGHDFDGTAIHNDSGAHRAADLLNARAFTFGRGI